MLKFCNTCKKLKPLNQFNKYHWNTYFFFRTYCKSCEHDKDEKRCFPRGWRYKNISFSRIFSKKVLFHKPQRLKYNVWNATLFVFRVSFRVSFSGTFSKHNVWNVTLLVFRVSFSRTFFKNKSSFTNRNVWKYNVITYFLEMFTLSFQNFLILYTMQLTDLITMIIPVPFHTFDN